MYGYTIYTTVNEYLGLLHILAIMNNAAMNIQVQVFYGHIFSFLLVIYLGVELLGHMQIYKKLLQFNGKSNQIFKNSQESE